MGLDRYFDNAATTPLDPRVREAMLPFLDQAFGNANSIHSLGLQAHEAVDRAREQIAGLLGAEDPGQIYFTSGATEANNWVLDAAEEVVISPFEHSAMREPALRLGSRVLPNEGTVIARLRSRSESEEGRSLIGVHSNAGIRELEEGIKRLEEASDKEADLQKKGELADIAQELKRRLNEYLRSLGIGNSEAEGCWYSPPSTLLSVMAVSNEIGSIWDVRDLAEQGEIVHSDVTQALGKIPITVEGLDYASFSAHKFYGPKGMGGLYCKGEVPLPLIMGGEQEHGYRGGTLNVPGIVGMGAAAEIAAGELDSDFEKASELRSILLDGLNGLSDVKVNGGDRTSPFIVSVSVRGIEGETLVLELDRAGYAISAGAACSSRSTEPSHVLRALKLEPEWLRGTVRVSFGRYNSKEATAGLAKKLRTTVELLRTL